MTTSLQFPSGPLDSAVDACHPSDSNLIDPFHNYPGRDDDLEKLDRLNAEYDRLAETFPEHWLSYGDADPLEAHRYLNPCLCGMIPSLQCLTSDMDVENGASREFSVVCACGACSDPSYSTWRACLDWNRNGLSTSQDWRSYPFFEVSEMEEGLAFIRLAWTRRMLGLRARLMTLQERLRHHRFGRKYLARIRAYEQWAHYMIELLRRQSGVTKSACRRAVKALAEGSYDPEIHWRRPPRDLDVSTQTLPADTSVDPCDPSRCREDISPDGKQHAVPRHINRIDSDSTHGWQVRYAGRSKLFSDGKHGGWSGALEVAKNHLRSVFNPD